MELNPYTLERLANYWIDGLQNTGRDEAWKVRRQEITPAEAKEKVRTKVQHFFRELEEAGGAEAVEATFDAVYEKADRLIKRRQIKL